MPGGERTAAAVDQARLHNAMGSWGVGGTCPSFLSGEWVSPEVFRSGFAPEDYARLRRIKRRFDPDNMFRVNFNIPPSNG